jgi:predicted  nucleic acid-binding Zn-ribbon protein
MKTAVKYATCIECGEDYNYKRKELGYPTCLDCGQASASRIIHRRTRENLREMAPHSYTGSVDDLFDKRGNG